MPKAAKTNITNPPKRSSDPVVDLARKLLMLWDADDASQVEHIKHNIGREIRDETLHQFRIWREAVETIISFTQAESHEGALV